jgi:hypothetical protein
MSRPLPKDASAKRAVLYSETATDAEKDALAEAYLEAERYGEALEFLQMTRNTELLDRIRAAALDLGDTFLLTQVDRFRDGGVAEADWKRIEERARSLGRDMDARRARGVLGIEEEEPEETPEA